MSTPSQEQRDGRRKATAASVAARKREATRRREATERRARQRTPGHHESCRCHFCVGAMNDQEREEPKPMTGLPLAFEEAQAILQNPFRPPTPLQ
jgi:uncharacterized protein (DUF1800 family)